jgi:tetratricopeptide (TPR) repeat protein
LYAAGRASNSDNRPAAAARQLRAALRELDRSGPTGTAEMRGRILLSLAWSEAERGRVDLGFRLLDEAERLIPPEQRGVLYGQRGLLLRRVGQDELALPQYDAAAALLTEQSDAFELAKVLSNRALVHLSAARVGPARADLRRSAQIAARHGFVLPATIARHNIGDLELLAGDIPSALSTYAAVARVYQDLAPGKLANLAIDRAKALLAAGLFGEADRELATALDGAEAQRQDHVSANALLVRAEAALLAGRPVAALAWATRARSRFLGRQNARRATLASLLALRAEYAASVAPPSSVARRARALAARLDQLGLAEDSRVAGLLATRALVSAGRASAARRELARHRRTRASDRLDTRLLWRLAQAEVAAAGGERVTASRSLRAGMATLHRYRSQLGCLDLQTGAAVHGRDLARAGLRGALANGSPADIFRWSESARAQALLLPPVRPPEDPDAVAALEALRQLRGALRKAELAGRPTGGLRARSEALQRTIRERSWSTAGTGPGGARPVSLGAVRGELSGAALVTYLRDVAVLWALVVTAGSTSLLRLGSFAEAEESLLRLRADLDAQAGRELPHRLAVAVGRATRNDAGALAAAILDPVLGLVGDRELVVVPTGTLVTVPWAVLPGCLQRPVTVAPSATIWSAASKRAAALVVGGPGDPLLVAGPGNERGEAEIRAIAHLWPQATVLTGQSATPAATLAHLDGAGIVHLAAHGHHATDNALFSALELSGGPLLGYDLQRVPATPALVVLSSCDLGLNDVRPGDETLGMTTALLSAGSSTVVASVNRVADDTAMAVMTGFHEAVSRGVRPAVALAGAVAPANAVGFVCFGAG